MNSNKWFNECTGTNDLMNEEERMIRGMNRNIWLIEWTGMNDSSNEHFVEWTGVN